MIEKSRMHEPRRDKDRSAERAEKAENDESRRARREREEGVKKGLF